MDEHDPIAEPPPPDPRLMAVQQKADALIAAVDNLPATLSRQHALAHADAVKIYAAQTIREEAQGA